MQTDSPSRPNRVRRVLYKRVLPGDLRKVQARSADSGTGGGARDLRLRPWSAFEAVVKRMFPATEERLTTRGRRSGREQVIVMVHKGRLRWQEDGEVRSQEVEFWPPTEARPNEGRLARVSQIPPFHPHRFPSGETGAVLYFLWEDQHGVWARYVTEASLRSGRWHADVAGPIVRALEKGEGENANVRGFIDLDNGEERHFDV